jgi:hypothetical protein
LIFKDTFNGHLAGGDPQQDTFEFPAGLLFIQFGNDFDQPLDGVTFPKSLLELRLGDKFNQPLDGVKFDHLMYLHTLRIGKGFHQSLNHVDFPPNLVAAIPTSFLKLDIIKLRELWIGVPSEQWPAPDLGRCCMCLEHNQLGQTVTPYSCPGEPHVVCKQCAQKWEREKQRKNEICTCPECRARVRFNYEKRDLVPTASTAMKFTDSFDGRFPDDFEFPKVVNFIDFGMSFNQSLDSVKLPNGLEILLFGDQFNKSLDKVGLPDALQVIRVGRAWNQSLENVTFPKNLKTLILGNSFNQSLDKVALPEGLEELRLGDAFNQPLERVKFPTSLKFLRIGRGFKQRLSGVEFPSHLEGVKTSVELLSLRRDFSSLLSLGVTDWAAVPLRYGSGPGAELWVGVPSEEWPRIEKIDIMRATAEGGLRRRLFRGAAVCVVLGVRILSILAGASS